MKQRKGGKGGSGGRADVEGDNSTARGGAGGDAAEGDGGRGGNASVIGDRSSAFGGKGGRGGIGPGQAGGDVEVIGDNSSAVGGQGGEAAQRDGRGGRGGRAPGVQKFGFERLHMRLPYGEPNDEPGRGGDSADTPQYKARRLIVECLKETYFRAKSIPMLSKHQVWYDREVVTTEWLNGQLASEGHRWRVTVVDDEYEFTDVPTQVR